MIVTAYEEFEAAREAIVLGVKDYLVKPITYDEVYDLMKRLEKKKGGTHQRGNRKAERKISGCTSISNKMFEFY